MWKLNKICFLQFFAPLAAPWKRLVAPPIFPAPMESHWAPQCGRPERGWTDKGMKSRYIQNCPKTSKTHWVRPALVQNFGQVHRIHAKKRYGNYFVPIFPNPPERESDRRNFPQCYQRERDWWRQRRWDGCQPWKLQNDSSDLHLKELEKRWKLKKLSVNDDTNILIQKSIIWLRSDIWLNLIFNRWYLFTID